jgi:hypothetical protein
MKAENFTQIKDLMGEREPLVAHVNALKGHTFRYIVFRNAEIECAIHEDDIKDSTITIRAMQELLVGLWEKRIAEIDRELESL